MFPEAESLLHRARQAAPNRRALREMGTLLPAGDIELDALLERLIEQGEPEQFTNVLVAAMAAGRRPDARHLVRGGPLLLDPSPLALAVHHMSGNVGAALVECVRQGQMGGEREAAALAAAAVWGQRQDPPVVPPDLIAQTRRIARRERGQFLVQQALMAVGLVTGDAGLRSVLTAVNGIESLELGRLFLDCFVAPVEKEPLAHWKETSEHTIASGFTMRRAVERVGRNEPCPCGSGKKYKKCCLEKDLTRLEHSSEVPGLTQEELRAEPERHLTSRRIAEMRSYDLARLDPVKVSPGFQAEVLRRMLQFDQHELALNLLEQAGYRPDLRAAIESLLHSLRKLWNPVLLRRLLTLLPAEVASDCTDFQVRLILAEDRGQLLDLVQAEILAALRSSNREEIARLIEIAYSLLDGPLAPLGIVLVRGLYPHAGPLDAWGLQDAATEARDRLDLTPDDLADELVESRLVRGHRDTPPSSEALNSALERIEEKSEEIRHLKGNLDKLQSELKRREEPAPPARPGPGEGHVQTPAPATTGPPTPTAPADEALLRELRHKVSDLRTALTERHSERNALRRELQQAQEALEALRAEREAGSGVASEDAGSEEASEADWLAEESFTTQPVRVIQFPPRFTETLRSLPRGVGRAAIVLAGRLAAGEAAAFRGVTRLRRNREIWRQRVGADHRLLLRLHADVLEVVDLINRRDLERRIKSLMVTGA